MTTTRSVASEARRLGSSRTRAARRRSVANARCATRGSSGRRAVRSRWKATRAAGDASDEDDSGRFINDDAFSALGGLKKTKDPFAANAARERPAVSKARGVGGFSKAGAETASLPTTRDADVILKRFDETQRREGAEAATTACERPAMERATRALASRASRVMLGICAASAEEGLAALKTWTAELGLPKGKLHGMDKDGIPVDPPKGAVFIKYNSLSGDAYISGYGGTFRGVLFTPELDDGAFRQYGYLPLDVLL